jgi:hypothetical protein
MDNSVLSLLQSFLFPANVKKYIRAGFLTADGKLTSEKGVKAIQRVVFEKFAAELEALADEEIEAKKENKE